MSRRPQSLHNGYHAFNYGCPWNAVQLAFDEYEQLRMCLIKKFNYDLIEIFKDALAFDALLPEKVRDFAGKTVAGSYLPKECFFEDELAEKRAALEKETLLKKIVQELEK